MKNRKRLELNDSVAQIIDKMSEGVIGALNVVMEILRADDGILTIMSLDDMNIRGSQIWIGYKDHCKEDLQAFISAVRDRSAPMVETINKNRGYPSDHVAVIGGASFKR